MGLIAASQNLWISEPLKTSFIEEDTPHKSFPLKGNVENGSEAVENSVTNERWSNQ